MQQRSEEGLQGFRMPARQACKPHTTPQPSLVVHLLASWPTGLLPHRTASITLAA